ncbi:MAG: hypothetical protein JW760_03590 [Spirochaetales bacterium]|nr:hypothetical protein [Spirochaetales bacterium]
MMLKRAVITIVLFIAAVFSLYSQDLDISGLYSDEASKLYLEGHYELADSCTATALEFNPHNSDALYVRAMLLYENFAGSGEAAALLLQALKNDSWNFFSASKGKEAAFRFLYESGAYEQAAALLDEPFLSFLGDEELYYFYILGLEKTGKTQDALRLTHYGNSLFPNSLRFKQVLLRLDDTYRSEVIETLVRRESSVPLEILPAALEATIDLAKRKVITDYYLEKGGTNLFVAIEKVRFEPSVSRDYFEDLSRNGLFNQPRALERLLSYLQTEEDKAVIRELFSQFSGISTAVHDDAGTTETRFSEGEPVEMSIRSKDGKIHVEVSFQEGIPVSLDITEIGKSARFLYAGYPSLASVEMRTPEGKNLYILRNGLSMSVLENLIPGFPIYSYYPDRLILQEEEIEGHAGRVVSMAEDLSSSDRVYTSEGEVMQHESMKQGMDKSMVLKDGLPTDGVMDLDQDGYYETRLLFQQGVLTGMQYDGNKNGITDYFYYPGEYPVQEWDFDENGFIDIREYYQEGKRYLEYYMNKETAPITYTREGSRWREVR